MNNLDKNHNRCPMEELLKIVTGQWTTHILWVVSKNSPIQFNELKRQIAGISAKVLTVRLRALEAEEIVSRQVKPTNPPQVYYSLTKKGRDLIGAFEHLNKVARKWAKQKSL
jgi:DNA-binding HxlR family transcriptional regulator